MKQLILTLGTVTIMLTSCASDGNKEASDSKIIKDDRLYSFMFGGVYFFRGFGGAKVVNDNLGYFQKLYFLENPGFESLAGQEFEKLYYLEK